MTKIIDFPGTTRRPKAGDTTFPMNRALWELFKQMMTEALMYCRETGAEPAAVLQSLLSAFREMREEGKPFPAE
jgi:hypothetical protein